MSDVPAATSEPPEVQPPAVARIKQIADRIKADVGGVFMGADHIVESLLIALLGRGHILLEGVPGVAKTTLVRAFARTLDARFNRIQFTPDLLPSDITGVYVPNLQTGEFLLREGPIFSNIVLGDEINRAPAKTQSALLEAMQERQVTIEGRTHKLEAPFLVLATQNPMEQEGVYALPEAQLDRFLLKVVVGYPSMEQEFRVLKTHQIPRAPLKAVINAPTVLEMTSIVDTVHVADELVQYIIKLARHTRDHAQVDLGVSPRAALALLVATKARAAIHGRDYVLPDDVRALASTVFSHRIILSPQAQLGGLGPQDVVRQAIQKIRYSEAPPR